MKRRTDYRLKRHHKFEHGGRKYVADLEADDIVEVNAVEWEILSRYGAQTQYDIVKELKQKYKVSSIFDGIERLEQLGRQGILLRAEIEAERLPHANGDRHPKLLVPFDFTKEKLALDHVTNLNRYRLLTHLTKSLGDKALAKRHTAAVFENPMFVRQPVIGLISGFEPNRGAVWISEFARSNPHLTIFVYDAVLARRALHLPENVVIFSVDSEETRTILPLFFQALDLVCFPAIPGTPLSVVSEAMAYGTACVVMTKYGMPAEVSGAGVAVKSDWDSFGNFRVPLRHLSETINGLLAPCGGRAAFADAAKGLMQRFTWEQTAGELVRLFEANFRKKRGFSKTASPLFPSIFCRQYDPGTGTIDTCAYRHGTGRYEHLETALAEVLSEHHTSAEVESVVKHFQRTGSAPTCDMIDAGNGFPSRGGQETNPAKMEHWQKGGVRNECQDLW